MAENFREAFNRKRYLLSQKIEVSDFLLSLLQDQGLLNEEHVGRLKATRSNHGNVRAANDLLDILGRTDDAKLNIFYESLETCGQEDALRILRGEPGDDGNLVDFK